MPTTRSAARPPSDDPGRDHPAAAEGDVIMSEMTEPSGARPEPGLVATTPTPFDRSDAQASALREAADEANEVGSVDLDFGDELAMDDELEATLQALESGARASVATEEGLDRVAASEGVGGVVGDIEDAEEGHMGSPMEVFRKKGWLSVSDLVGTVWCEVQYDYRLRTLPFLPPSQRPEVIKTKTGEPIKVDKVKVEDKERILVRGQKIHKRLEREVFPEEIVIRTHTREDVWGLRFLTMFSCMEALLTLGKCREMPVVGFVQGVQIMGIIDELVLQPVSSDPSTSRSTRSSKASPDPNQTKLSSFFASTSSPRTAQPARRQRTHRLLISDSKTRASGHLPQEDDARAARLQVMCYKELLDGMLLSPFVDSGHDPPPPTPPSLLAASSARPGEPLLPSRCGFAFEHLFSTLDISLTEPLSELFLQESRPIILGNGLKHGSAESKTLGELIVVWGRYVRALGLGDPPASTPGRRDEEANGTKGKRMDSSASRAGEADWGKTEDTLQLVYRRAGAVKRYRRRDGTKGKDEGEDEQKTKGGRRGKKRGRRRKKVDGQVESDGEATAELAETHEEESRISTDEADPELQQAIALSLDSKVSTGHNGLVAAAPDAETISIPSFVPQPEEALKDSPDEPTDHPSRTTTHVLQSDEEQDREEDELALAIELSLGTLNPIGGDPGLDEEHQGEGIIPLRLSQPQSTDPTATHGETSALASRVELALGKGTGSGSIIGTSTFRHSPRLLAAHLEHVLLYWRGEREPVGVPLEHTRRCGWCEFEEGCEWRRAKAMEMWERRAQ